MKYRLAIFDFDGTLADSFPFFVRVFNQIAEQYNFNKIEPGSATAFRHFTPRQLMEQFGVPGWKLPFVAQRFIALMRQHADDIALFEQVDEMLLYLANHGVTLAIVSSNAQDNVHRILGPANAKLFRQFECGMSIFGKPARIRKVLKQTGVSAHEAIYIGDQVTDLEAARKVNVAFGAVSWGYGAIELLRQHAPEEEFESVSAIKRIVSHNNFAD